MGLTIGVLGLQGAVSEHINQFKNCNITAMALRDKSRIESIHGIVIPGGESTTIGLLMQKSGLFDAVKERHKKGLPVLGTCAGMVLAASSVIDGKGRQPLLALMDIEVKRNAFGRQKESFEEDINISGKDKPFKGVFIRAPIIVEYSKDVEVLATMNEGVVAARQKNTLVTSFHPELTDDLFIHSMFLEMCKDFAASM